MRRFSLSLLLIVSLLIVLAGVFLLRPHTFNGSILQVPKREGQIVLRSADGPVRLSDYSGKIVLMYFGYTFCPDVCPTTLAKVKQALNGLSPEETSQVEVVFVSVDTQRDTYEHLQEYVHVFSPTFIGASGTSSDIDLIAESLGVSYKINPPDADGNYTVDHSSYIYVIDRQGYLVMTWGHDIQPDEITDDLRYMLKHGIPISAQIFSGPTPTPVVCSLTLVPAHVQGGEWLYQHHCAQCHGADLKGNPAWETELTDGSHLPPPLDSTGQAWKYSESELIALVRSGRNLDKPIHMPAFKSSLSDWEIHFIGQYLASHWDVHQRNYQAGFLTLTPQPTGIPSLTPTATLSP